MNRHFAFILILLSPVICHSQVLKMKVVDAEDKSALAFANITLSPGNFGTVSNSEGYFHIGNNDLKSTDTLRVSYMGYKTFMSPVDELSNFNQIELIPENIKLGEVRIYSGNPDAREIVEKAVKHFDENHPSLNQKERIFIHNFTQTPFSKSNQFEVLKTDFENFDTSTPEKLKSLMPEEFTDYSDAIIDLYSLDNEKKIVPENAISLEESSQAEIQETVEEILEDFIEEFRNSIKEEDVYYKFKTGIIGAKIGDEKEDEENDESEDEEGEDDQFKVPSSVIKTEIVDLMKDYAQIEGKNLEFLSKPGRYKYELEGIKYFNDEAVFLINFKPAFRGHFEGSIYISNASFAILQMDFRFAPGKSMENIQLFGIGHSKTFKSARVIFEKWKTGYFPKYLNIEEHEYFSFDRKFSIIKKRERLFIDKNLKKLKINADLNFTSKSHWEILVMQRNDISENEFKNVNQPKHVVFQKEYSNRNDFFKKNTVIAPSGELKNYKRKDL